MVLPYLQDAQRAIIDLIPELRRFARSLTRSDDAAEELVQAACERALCGKHELAAVEQPSKWMRCIIRNIWIDEKRSSHARLSVPLEDEHFATEDTERTVIARSTLARVRIEVAGLPENLRAPIMLVCVEGLSYREAAAELGVPIGTLMSLLYRGLLELARRMASPPQGLDLRGSCRPLPVRQNEPGAPSLGRPANDHTGLNVVMESNRNRGRRLRMRKRVERA
jgi:RNA polymerase sigma-70 factor (ECF subfamily)